MNLFKMLKWAFVVTGVFLLLVIAGGRVYQVFSEAADMARFPPPGEMVEVDGRMMHIDCQGEGSPTVLIEQGLQSVSLSWDDLSKEIATFTRVCSYDRVGLGYSDPVGHMTRSTEVAQILHKLLTNAGIDDDMVMVGWSAGGVYIRDYQRLFPEKVRAMLFVDSSHEQQQHRIPSSGDGGGVSKTLLLAKYLAPIGIVRLSGLANNRIEFSRAPEHLKPQLIALYEKSHVPATILNESASFTLDTSSETPPPSLGDMPVIVLSRGLSDESPERQIARQEMQEELAALSTNGRRIIATQSGHDIHYDQPDLVIDSVKELVERVRETGS